jgi:mannose-6-phosphate isomerase-like protein (cupin superfamily)
MTMQNTAMLSPAAPALLRVGGRKAVKVDAREDRSGRALQFSNWRFDCKVSAEDTAGAYCIYDTARTARGGPPMHVHHSQDEWFLVRDGEFKFVIGDETFQLKPGDTLLGPRGVPHAFASLSETSALLIAFIPAGGIETLFKEVSDVNRLRLPTLEDWRTISRAHDVDIVGPPLPVS